MYMQRVCFASSAIEGVARSKFAELQYIIIKWIMLYKWNQWDL